MDRFPEVVHTQPNETSIEDRPSHDVFSVVFHLCHAASLYNVPACLSLARARVGLETCLGLGLILFQLILNRQRSYV